MMPTIVRKGDTSDHGGAVVTGSDNWDCMGQPIARLGDILDCPIHGPNPIVTASGKHDCNARGIARTGDKAACGASLIAGQAKWSCE